MKRIISFILALSMIFSLGITAFADVTYSADKNSIKKGETVAVTINNGEKMENITSFEYRLYFDPELFELKSSEIGTANTIVKVTSVAKEDTKGTYYGVSLVDATSEGLEVAEGVIATLVFEAIKEVETDSEASFELVKKSVMDTSWSEIEAGSVNGESVFVTVVPTVEPFSYTISDTPSNGDDWAKLGSGTISGEAGGVIEHSWIDNRTVIVALTPETPDGAVINVSFAASGMRPSLSGNGDITLVDGSATKKITLSSPFDTIGTWTVILTKDNAPVLAEGQNAETSSETTVGEEFTVDLKDVFSDAEGDALSYQIKVNDGSFENFEGNSYSFTSNLSGEYALVFRAYDGIRYSSETYTINLTVKNSTVTFDVKVNVPENIEPKFYTSSETGTLGTEISAEKSGNIYTVKVPENASHIAWRADDIGMSTAVSAETGEITLVKADFKFTWEGTETSASIKVSQNGVDAIGKENSFLLLSAEGYTYAVTPGSAYRTKTLENQTPANGENEIEIEIKHFKVTAPKGSVVSAGTLNGSFAYSFASNIDMETVGETVVYRFAPLSKNAFIRVQNPDNKDAVTYWDWNSSKADGAEIVITEEMLFMNDSGEDKYDSDTVYRNFEKYEMDLGDIYMNINNQGYVNLNVGDSKGLNMFRNWQAINCYTNDKISLPDFSYEIINIEGENVISITPNANNSGAATMTANGKGTAIVLVTYDAMYSDSTVKNSNGDAGGGNRYSAIWPDRTGVFVVSVGKDGTAIKSNMTCNGAVFDAEHSPQFYTGNEGAKVSFKPEEGVTVTVNRSTVGKETLSFGKFTSEGVTVAEDGTVTVSGLKTGRHIIRLEKGGVASYQVVTAQQTTVEYVYNGRTVETPIVPAGESITIKIKGLTNPAEKFATKYNFNAQLTYKDENGNAYRNSSGAAFGKYNFSSQEQIVEVTIPADWEGETMTLNGFIQMGGFSGGAIGDHREVSYGAASGMATGTGAGMTLATLPEIVITVGEIPATEITFDKTSIKVEVDTTETITATVKPENTTDIVEWSSADESIATVENGVVTGKKAGKTTVTAKIGELTATCEVEVWGSAKEFHIVTGSAAPGVNTFALSNIDIYGASGNLLDSTSKTEYTIELVPETDRTKPIKFDLTAVGKGANNIKQFGSTAYFWAVSGETKVRSADNIKNKNPQSLEIVPEWDENGVATITVCTNPSTYGNTKHTLYNITLKIAEPPAHECSYVNTVADEKYLASEATCTEPAKYYKSCECGEAGEETFSYGKELGHDWGEPEYKWADDGSSCEAKRVCSRNQQHVENAKAAEIKSEVAKPATCSAMGDTRYEAIFEENWAHDYKTVTDIEIDKDAHAWTVSYDWSEDGKACTATKACANNAEHNLTAEATVTSVVAKEANCSAMGDTQYTATFAADWAETQVTVRTDIAIDEDAHEWGEWKVVREATYKEKGLKERECNLCEDKETDDIPKLTKPSKPSKPSDKPNPGVTVIVPGNKGEEEKNPNTGAPVFDMTFAGAVVLAATAIFLGKKNK